MDAVLAAGILLCLILPISGFVTEKYIMLLTLQEISDAVDMACMSAYQALNPGAASDSRILVEPEKFESGFRYYLALNLKLTDDMMPEPGAIVTGQVHIRELTIYTGPFPEQCSRGTSLSGPTVHAVITAGAHDGILRPLLAGNGETRQVTVHRDVDLLIDD
ncbi:MAG TPA: hypothetical protein DD727_07310 [Clostridiales bacterium]|nr:hypothetical protein [Clostridiales bacterium]